jgi:hypothetical protein
MNFLELGNQEECGFWVTEGESGKEEIRMVMPLHLLKKIKEVWQDLKWPIELWPHRSNDTSIKSNPWKKVHRINFPDTRWEGYHDHENVMPGYTALCFLHELGHAYLCETVHHFFATTYYHDSVTLDQMNTLYSPVSVAKDWFVNDLMFRWVRKEETFDTLDCLKPVLNGDHHHLSGGDLLYPSMIIAMVVHEKLKQITIPKVYREIVKIFRKYQPDKPSLDNLVKLSN